MQQNKRQCSDSVTQYNTALNPIMDEVVLLKTRLVSFSKSSTWFRSYLTDRFQCVAIGPSWSHTVVVRKGVPQGWVLGPLLFCICMLPLGNIMRKYRLTLSWHCRCQCSPCQMPAGHQSVDAVEFPAAKLQKGRGHPWHLALAPS